MLTLSLMTSTEITFQLINLAYLQLLLLWFTGKSCHIMIYLWFNILLSVFISSTFEILSNSNISVFVKSLLLGFRIHAKTFQVLLLSQKILCSGLLFLKADWDSLLKSVCYFLLKGAPSKCTMYVPPSQHLPAFSAEAEQHVQPCLMITWTAAFHTVCWLQFVRHIINK